MTPPTDTSANEPLRIAILASAMKGGGGLSVGLNMIAAWARVAPQNEYFCVAPAGLGYEEVVAGFPHGTLLARQRTDLLRRWWFETVTLPNAVREFQPDLAVGLGGRGLLRPSCAQAVFPQDSHYLYPTRHFGQETLLRRLKIRYHKRYFARQLPRTQLVLVQTDVVERRLRETFGYRGRALVCKSSVSPFLRQGRTGRPMPPALAPLQNKLKLLYISVYGAHKNFPTVLELFRRYRNELRDVVVITSLTPQQHARAGPYLRAVERYGLTGQLCNVGQIPHQDIGAYYEHCDAFFMPTLLETFGIPYLEAMHFDLPILTSNLDFAHATCGDAACYCDPWNLESMRDAILRLKSDPALRARLIEAGRRRRTEHFPTWDEIAKQVMHSFRTVVAEYRQSQHT
jgi:glycosyltransferase involved in cell wall biosynthesis